MRALLSSKNEFQWDLNQDVAFANAKEMLSSSPVLAYYDPRRPTALHDASKLHGLGFMLTQQQPDNTWRMVQAGSRTLSVAESRYATIEMEMLAITWAVCNCRIFLEGLPQF